MGVWVCEIRPGPMGAYLGRRRATPRPPGSSWHLFSGSVGRSVVAAAAAAAAAVAATAAVAVVVVVVARAWKFRT